METAAEYPSVVPHGRPQGLHGAPPWYHSPLFSTPLPSFLYYVSFLIHLLKRNHKTRIASFVARNEAPRSQHSHRGRSRLQGPPRSLSSFPSHHPPPYYLIYLISLILWLFLLQSWFPFILMSYHVHYFLLDLQIFYDYPSSCFKSRYLTFNY